MKLTTDELLWRKYITLHLRPVFKSLSDAYAECDSSSYINLDEIDKCLEEFLDELSGRMANLCGSERAKEADRSN